MRIVILEDDPDQANLLQAWLEEDGHNCTVFGKGNEFLRDYTNESYDLAILDWMVPQASGIEVLKHLRTRLDPDLPVIFITQRDAEEDIVEALQNGADDYMAKPIRQAETIARINAIGRRAGHGSDTAGKSYSMDPYRIDTQKRSVSYNGEPVDMTQKEYELALFLFKNIGRVISRGHLLEMVWGTSSSINTRTVDTHMSRLRGKLNFDSEPDWTLTSIYRHGYRLEHHQQSDRTGSD